MTPGQRAFFFTVFIAWIAFIVVQAVKVALS